MCKLGGGDENRCLKHHVVSKFVVKIVTVRTKADEAVVSQTLSTLNKEGKNLPNPEPEVVKNWLDTEKFKTEYDPDLNNHDRKIQMNRLNSANPEKVKGSHFHAWKNLEKAVRSKVAKRIGAAGLVIGMSASLVGCFATGGGNKNEIVPSNSPTTISAPASYGSAIGSGEQVKTSDGSYEKIIVDKNASVYAYNDGMGGNPPYMEEAGWSAEDGIAAQKVAVDYMVQEFIDSSALDGGAKEYKEWYETSAKKYFGSDTYKEKALKDGSGKAILGNASGENLIPKLIHDGTPREKTLNMSMSGFGPYEDEAGYKGLEYSIEYTVEYRVNDANAAEFAGSHTGMSGKDFLKSDSASDSLKDGSGENIYIVKGYANIVLDKDKNGDFKIIGFDADSEFDASAFEK